MRTTQPTPVAPANLGNVVRSLSFAETPAPPPKSPPKKRAPAIRVVVRIRPLSEKERRQSPESCLIPSDDPRTLHIRLGNPLAHRPNRRAAGKATFRFATIFRQDAEQSTVFENTALPLIDGLFQGSSSVVFAYGVTGSGKTWTIAGDRSNPGILPRALDVIVNSIAVSKGHGLRQDSTVTDGVAILTEGSCFHRRRRNKAEEKVHDNNYITVDGTVDYSIFASYIEVYNEQVYDLFESVSVSKEEPMEVDPARTEPSPVEDCSHAEEPRRTQRRRILKLREDSSGEVYADGQTECEIKSGADIDRLLEFGCRNRSVAHTLANEHSSRSHAIFIITLKQCRTVPQASGHPKVFRTSAKLHIVDLAGTERSSNCANNLRSKETSQINLSLMNLSRCFETLRKNQRIQRRDASKPLDKVPFRNSRLTRLLQHSLTSGSAVMIANVSPFADNADDTIKALQTGASVQEVKIRPTMQVLSDVTNIVDRAPAKDSRSPPTLRVTRSRAIRRANTKEGLKKQALLERENESLAATNERMKNDIEEYQSKDIAKDKVIAQLQDAVEELQMDVAARDKELDQLFLEKERLAEQVAVDQAAFRWMETEIREEVYKEAEQLIKEIQDRCEEQVRQALDKKEDLRRRELLMSERERKEYADKVARRLSRASIAAVDEVIPNLQEEEESDEEEEQWSSDDGDECVSEEDDYEEEDSPRDA